MLSGSQKIIGFHILANGRFLIRHTNQIEILSNDAKNTIEINIDPEITKDTRIKQIVEIPNQRLAIGFDKGKYYPQPKRILAIFDYTNGECIAKKQIPTVNNLNENTINSISVLPNNQLLLNSRYICSIKNSNLIIEEDKQYINFDGATPSQPNQFVPLLDQSGFIYFNNRDEYEQDNLPIVKIITNEFKEIAHLQLGSPYNNVKYKNVKIHDLKPISLDYFACISETKERYPLFNVNETWHLRIISNDFKQSHKIDLQGISFRKLIALNNEYVAVVGEILKKNSFRSIVKVFDLQCKLVTEFIITSDIFINAAPNGQLVTCDEEGNIVLHNVIPANKLRKKIESVLAEGKPAIMIKDLIPIVTEYAGLFKPKLDMPKIKFAEVDHPFDQKPMDLKTCLKSFK